MRTSGWLRLCTVMLLVATAAGAQTITLQIKPQVGDTIRMRLDQQSEMSGVRRTESGESSALVVNGMSMFSRAIVEGASGAGTNVLAVTDSVRMSTSDDRSRPAVVQAEQALRGQRVRFRVFPDGTVGVAGAGGTSPGDVAQVVSLMPAAFPRAPIKVGESWMRDMPLPAGNQLGARISGKLHVTFRLDSLTHSGEWAFVSMRGEMEPATGPGAAEEATLERGYVNGTMLVDRKRGWLTESWFNIVVNSTATPPPSSGVLSMRMQMRITQHMHAFDRR